MHKKGPCKLHGPFFLLLGGTLHGGLSCRLGGWFKSERGHLLDISKGLLAFDSFREAFGAQLVFEQTAAPESDVRALVRSLALALGGPAGRLAASVMAQAQDDPEVQKLFLEQFSIPLRLHSAQVIGAGIEAGAFRRDLDVQRLLDAMVGAVYLRLMFGLPLDEAWADALSTTLLGGCLP